MDGIPKKLGGLPATVLARPPDGTSVEKGALTSVAETGGTPAVRDDDFSRTKLSARLEALRKSNPGLDCLVQGGGSVYWERLASTLTALRPSLSAEEKAALGHCATGYVEGQIRCGQFANLQGMGELLKTLDILGMGMAPTETAELETWRGRISAGEMSSMSVSTFSRHESDGTHFSSSYHREFIPRAKGYEGERQAFARHAEAWLKANNPWVRENGLTSEQLGQVMKWREAIIWLRDRPALALNQLLMLPPG